MHDREMWRERVARVDERLESGITLIQAEQGQNDYGREWLPA